MSLLPTLAIHTKLTDQSVPDVTHTAAWQSRQLTLISVAAPLIPLAIGIRLTVGFIRWRKPNSHTIARTEPETTRAF